MVRILLPLCFLLAACPGPPATFVSDAGQEPDLGSEDLDTGDDASDEPDADTSYSDVSELDADDEDTHPPDDSGDDVADVIADPVDPCEDPDRQPPASWRRMTTGSESCRWDGSGSFIASADCTHWEGIWPAPFQPGSNSLQRYIGIWGSDGRDYVAIRFNTGPIDDDFRRGTFLFDAAPNITNTRRIASISQCPGDFDRAALTEEGGSGCVVLLDGFAGQVIWGGVDSSPARCRLLPNTDYYLNLVFTDSSLDNLTWDSISPHPNCVDSRCATLMVGR